MAVKSLAPKKALNVLWDYVVLTFGVFLYAFSWADMLIPNEIASGGLIGACTVLFYGTGIPVSASYLVLNSFLIILGTLILGKGFGFKTIYAILLSTLLLDVLQEQEFLYQIYSSKLLLVIVAGAMESIGLSLIIDRGGSTGGTDIVALIINKYWPVSLGKVFLTVDFFIIMSILLVPGKTVEDMIYGYIAMIIFSVTVDWVTLGRKSTWMVLVFSEKSAEIADYIISQMDRGVTALKSVGWYTKQEKDILLILVRKNQLRELTRVIKSLDSKAFVSVSSASTVYGEGFDEIKTGVKLKNLKFSNKET